MNLDQLPDGSRCFLDANILAYHVVLNPDFSPMAGRLLARTAKGQIAAFTTSVTLSECLHAIMLAEVASRFPQASRPLAYVQKHPQIIGSLSIYRAAAARLAGVGLTLLPVDLDDWAQAAQVAATESLLTNDALVVAIMRRHNLVYLATNDADFAAVAGITVCKPC